MHPVMEIAAALGDTLTVGDSVQTTVTKIGIKVLIHYKLDNLSSKCV